MLTKHTVLYTGERFIHLNPQQPPPDFARTQSSSGTCNEDKPFLWACTQEIAIEWEILVNLRCLIRSNCMQLDKSVLIALDSQKKQ